MQEVYRGGRLARPYKRSCPILSAALLPKGWETTVVNSYAYRFWCQAQAVRRIESRSV